MTLVKRIALIAALCLVLRGFVALGAETALDSLLQTAVSSEAVESTVLSQSPLLRATAYGGEAEAGEEAQAAVDDTQENVEDSEDEDHLPVYVADAPLGDGEADSEVEEVTITGGDGYQSAAGIYLKNSTDYEVDIEALLNEPLSFTVDSEAPQVLIIHTHGSEAYTPDGDDWYEETDSYRSEDETVNVIRVGDEMAAVFEENGVSVIHDRSLYDYPSYIGSYSRSLEAVEQYLAEYPDIKLVIDVHRDAILDDNGNYMKTVANIDGVESSQVMLVVGTDSSGLEHSGWRENLKFALRLQSAMNETYPSLARPVNLREERFNQHLAPGALIVEVGSNGNTLQEAITAGRLFAECASSVINDMIA